MVDDADKFLLGIDADDALGLTFHGTDEQERDATYLEHVGNITVLINIDAVEVHLAVVILGNLAQHGIEASARQAPVGIEIHDNWTWAEHIPVGGMVVSYEFLELVLADGVYGIDGIRVGTIALGAGTEGQ